MRSALREDLGGFLIGLYQQRLFCVTPRGASLGPDFLTPLAREDSRHAISGEIARGRFGGGAAWAGPPVEGCQPEPRASIVGRGSRRNGPRGGCEDWGHGPSDASRLGSPLQRLGCGRPSRRLDRRAEAPLVIRADGRGRPNCWSWPLWLCPTPTPT